MISKTDAIISLGVNGSFWELPTGEIKFNDNYNGIKPTEEEIQAKIAELRAAEPLRQLRIQRNQLLASTDWRMTNDYPYADQSAWASYRTQLRNLPESAEPTLDENGQLTNVVWPTAPDAT